MSLAAIESGAGFSVETYPTRAEMSQAAFAAVSDHIRDLLRERDTVRIIFAAAPSQAKMLELLARDASVDWSRVVAFNMDEYIGLEQDDPARFNAWLNRHFYDHVDLKAVHRLAPEPDSQTASRRYADLLAEHPIDVACMGIGVNGHIAFNDPPVADFDDPEAVKVVTLDDACRQQQVDDECFATFDDVPQRAITLTIPTLMAAQRIFCVVPGARKRKAVHCTLNGPITADCPASVLRRHGNCTLFLDKESNPDG